jgi:hypothetical protein
MSQNRKKKKKKKKKKGNENTQYNQVGTSYELAALN